MSSYYDYLQSQDRNYAPFPLGDDEHFVGEPRVFEEENLTASQQGSTDVMDCFLEWRPPYTSNQIYDVVSSAGRSRTSFEYREDSSGGINDEENTETASGTPTAFAEELEVLLRAPPSLKVHIRTDTLNRDHNPEEDDPKINKMYVPGGKTLDQWKQQGYRDESPEPHMDRQQSQRSPLAQTSMASQPCGSRVKYEHDIYPVDSGSGTSVEQLSHAVKHEYEQSLLPSMPAVSQSSSSYATAVKDGNANPWIKRERHP